MKKTITILAMVLLSTLFLSCATTDEPTAITSEPSQAAVSTSPSTTPSATPQPTPTPTAAQTSPPEPDPETSTAKEYLEYLDYYGIYDRDEEKYDQIIATLPESEDDMAICNLFPDPQFALTVALQFNKRTDDTVTLEELAKASRPEFSSLVENLEGLQYFTGTKNLDLEKAYNIRILPEDIGDCENLESIVMESSGLESLPASIGNLKKLKVLNISAADSVTELPEEIGNCESLETLAIGGTGITSLPDSICNLKNLKAIGAGHLGLTELPENMGDLTNLESLFLFGNELTQLPESMKNLKKLTYLNVYDNYDLDDEYTEWFDESVYNIT